MRKYLAQRLLIAIPTLFGVTLLIFIAMRVLPGDPLSAISGEGGGTYVLSPEQLKAARASLGLDRPYAVQYLDWLRRLRESRARCPHRSATTRFPHPGPAG